MTFSLPRFTVSSVGGVRCTQRTMRYGSRTEEILERHRRPTSLRSQTLKGQCPARGHRPFSSLMRSRSDASIDVVGYSLTISAHPPISTMMMPPTTIAQMIGLKLTGWIVS